MFVYVGAHEKLHRSEFDGYFVICTWDADGGTRGVLQNNIL